MVSDETLTMKTCIVYIPCSWDRVPRSFFESFLAMTAYPVQEELRKKYDVQLKFMVSATFPLDRNRNEAVELCIERYKADWIMFIDADMVFPKETLPYLFEHTLDGHKVITGNYHKKQGPHQSVVGTFCQWTPQMAKFQETLKKHGYVSDDGDNLLFHTAANDWRYERPFQVDVSGMGCVLVHSEVFKRLKQPYFKYLDTYMTDDIALEGISEDIWFYTQCKKAKIKVLCDPRVQCGHLTEREVTFLDQSPIMEVPNGQTADALTA